MATPTSKPTQSKPSGPYTPSATGNAGSPSHLSNKALTRSPAAARTRAGTLSRMEHSASQQGATPGSWKAGSSPAPAMMGTPSGGHGFGHAFGATPTPGSVGMTRGASVGLGVHGLSGMGTSADGMVLMSDKELIMRGKIREIITLFKHEWGFVSRVGIQRAADRLKLDVAWETGPEEDPGVLDVAGEGMMVTITFQKWRVQDVALEFIVQNQDTSTDAEKEKKEEEKRGAEILKRDLQGWEGETERGEYIQLRRFGENMEYLGAIDNLGKGGVSCFDAISGICRALKQANAWWKTRNDESKSSDRFEMLAKGLGWPQMHSNGHVGLVLSYWIQRWQTKQKACPSSYLEIPTDVDPALYSMRIGVDHIDPSIVVHPIKLSSDWFEFLDDMPVDGDINMASNAQFPPLQLVAKNPEPTYLPAAEEPGADTMDIDGQAPAKPLPNIMFKAFFEPALPVGWNTSVQQLLVDRVGLMMQSAMVPVPYFQLVLPGQGIYANSQTAKGGQAFRGDADVAPLRFEKMATGMSGKKGMLKYSVLGTQLLQAYSVTDFPFGHPMELLTALPTLRMWAWLHGLFTRSFGSDSEQVKSAKKPGMDAAPGASKSADTASQDEKKYGKAKGKKLHLRDLTAAQYRRRLKAGLPIPTDDPSGSEDEAPDSELIEITVQFPNDVNTFNHVYLDISIPIDEDSDPVVAFLAVKPGPEVVVRGASEGDPFAAAMARVLYMAEEFGVLVRWVRNRRPKADKMEE